MINYYTIGQRVKEARKKKRLSQADLADLIDKSASYINVHESVSGNEFSEQLKGCSLYECRVILDVTKAIKESLRENAFIKRTAK